MGQLDERVALVDAKNQIIGFKLYSELTDDDCWRIVSIWVENGRGQVLLQQRSFDKKLAPGAWTPAAEGTVTEEDDYLSTAERELAEEIGLNNIELKPTKLLHRKFGLGWRQVQGYKTICDWPLEKFCVQKEEVVQLAWVDKAELLAELRGAKPFSRLYPTSVKYWLELFDLK